MLLSAGFAITMLAAVPFTTIVEGQQSGIEERREVAVRTAAEWQALWRQHAPDQPLPKVDFAKEMVIGVFAGMRNTGGYSVRIAAIEQDGNSLRVMPRESGPPADAIVTQMITYPFILVRTARVDGKVTFVPSR